MNRYSRILHHLDIEDVKLKCLDEIAAREIEEKNRKIEEEYISKKMESWGYDWRKELSEQMTTSSMMYTRLSPEGDEALDTMTVASHYSALTVAQVVSSGSGTGDDGGFNVGQDYLNVGWTVGSNSVILKDIDTRQVDTITFSVIKGNGSNGGEAPDSPLELMIQSNGTADNPTGSYGPVAMVASWYDFSSAATDPNYNPPEGGYNASGYLTPLTHLITSAGVEDYSIKIPPWHQRENARFALSTAGIDPIMSWGVVDIKLQRKTPMNVWVGLDDPEASVFVRVGQGSGTTSPKKRKKRVQDILASGEKYTTINMGPDFPGSGARLDDPQMPHKQVADIQQANRNTVENRVQKYWEDPNRKSDWISSEMRKEMRAELDNLSRKSSEASQRALKLPRRKGESWQDHRKRQDAIHHGTRSGEWGTHNGRRQLYLHLLLKHPIPEANARLAKADASKNFYNSSIKPILDKRDAFTDKHGRNLHGYNNPALDAAYAALQKEINDAIRAYNEFNKKSWKEFLGTDNVEGTKGDATEVDDIKDQLDDTDKEELEKYMASDKVDPKDVKSGIADFLLDRIADVLEVGLAKDVFDYHIDKWMKNPTDKPQDVTKLVRSNDMKALTDWAGRYDFDKTLNKDVANAELLTVAKRTPGLRNTLGNIDLDRGDGITKITPNYIEITKAYDFDSPQKGQESDYLGGGGNPLLKYGAPLYAAMKGHTGGSKKMNTVIRIPLKGKNKVTESAWRDELKEVTGFEWVRAALTGPTNSASASFSGEYFGNPTGDTFTASGVGGSDALPSSVNVSIEGESMSVDPPSYDKFPIAGTPYPTNFDIWRKENKRSAKEINKQLDTSEKIAKKAKADVLMKARIEYDKTKEDLEREQRKLEAIGKKRSKFIEILDKEKSDFLEKWEKEYQKMHNHHHDKIAEWNKKNAYRIKASGFPTAEWNNWIDKQNKIYYRFLNSRKSVEEQFKKEHELKYKKMIGQLDKEYNEQNKKVIEAQLAFNKAEKKWQSFGSKPVNQNDPSTATTILMGLIERFTPDEGLKFFNLSRAETDAIMTAGTAFIDYLLRGDDYTIDRNYLGQRYMDYFFKNATFDENTTFGKDALIGTGSAPVYNPSTGLIEVKANFDFKRNMEELRTEWKKGKYDTAYKKYQALMYTFGVGAVPGMGYAMDAMMDPLGPVGGLIGSLLASPAITIAKLLGKAKARNISIKFTPAELKEKNSVQYYYLMSLGIIPDPYKSIKLPDGAGKGAHKPVEEPQEKITKAQKVRKALSLDEPIIPTKSTKTTKKRKKKKRKTRYSSGVQSKNKVMESVSMKKKLKTTKEFFKQADIKPTFPENPPPELDPKTGMHPNYGKQAARYKKLDPISARAMPKTGDPEIDTQVKKAAKKPK